MAYVNPNHHLTMLNYSDRLLHLSSAIQDVSRGIMREYGPQNHEAETHQRAMKAAADRAGALAVELANLGRFIAADYPLRQVMHR